MCALSISVSCLITHNIPTLNVKANPSAWPGANPAWITSAALSSHDHHQQLLDKPIKVARILLASRVPTIGIRRARSPVTASLAAAAAAVGVGSGGAKRRKGRGVLLLVCVWECVYCTHHTQFVSFMCTQVHMAMHCERGSSDVCIQNALCTACVCTFLILNTKRQSRFL